MPQGQDKVPPTTEPENESVPLTEVVNYYDRNRAAISLLGCFNVRDKEGNDITANFTPRLKHLLILLILYIRKKCQRYLNLQNYGNHLGPG